MTMKKFISPEFLLKDSFRLARKIYDSGYRPDAMVALWRGGAPIGLAVHEFMCYKGVNVDHMIVKAESYSGIGKRGEPRIGDMNVILSALGRDSKVIIVDDIYDTGCTVRKVREILFKKTRNVKIATLYLKKGAIESPDFFVRKVTGWIVFPHEIADLSLDEIRDKNEYIHSLLVEE
ncbi:MAG: phosphoribosyltransferase family protein [Kiritimatiellae bacterium]|nr:phosphoribosyltransferase family protein [Kiritimatiellia bacterium]MDD5521403.1 phosphoribosyltransferase family protein [Kiritimatiellia bacterium]